MRGVIADGIRKADASAIDCSKLKAMAIRQVFRIDESGLEEDETGLTEDEIEIGQALMLKI